MHFADHCLTNSVSAKSGKQRSLAALFGSAGPKHPPSVARANAASRTAERAGPEVHRQLLVVAPETLSPHAEPLLSSVPRKQQQQQQLPHVHTALTSAALINGAAGKYCAPVCTRTPASPQFRQVNDSAAAHLCTPPRCTVGRATQDAGNCTDTADTVTPILPQADVKDAWDATVTLSPATPKAQIQQVS